jgi:hypothetical protein
MNELPRYKFSREYEYFDHNKETYRKTSFSILKHNVYTSSDEALRHADRLQKLKEDDFKYDGKINVPYFEFKVEDNVLIYQSEFVKGVAPTNNDMKHVYDKLVFRPGAYTFLDYTPANFIVDKYGIHVVDLDSYGSHNFEKRIKRWNETIKKYKINI